MKKLLALTWILVFASLLFLQSRFKSESTTFFGITDNSAQTISFEYPVDIIELAVIDGQKVEQEDILLKVRRSSLSAEKAILKEKINELNSRKSTSISSVKSEIRSLRAKKMAELTDLDVKIQKLEAQYRNNKQLLLDITGSNVPTNESTNPIYAQINVLRKQKKYLGRSIQTQINHLRSQLKSGDKPIHAQINELKQRSSELERQTDELIVKAKLSGQVGNIQYKQGDTIEAFQPLFSIHALQPEHVKGYINEHVYNQVKAGQKVWVTSLTAKDSSMAQVGIVNNVGNRIVEYPDRLKKNIQVPAFGREVQISLSKTNNLLLGEKVYIGLQPPSPPFSETAMNFLMDFINSYAKEGGEYAANN